MKTFFYMTKKSRQFKDLENRKSFSDEIKSIFHHFYRAFIEANKPIFFKKKKTQMSFVQKLSCINDKPIKN